MAVDETPVDVSSLSSPRLSASKCSEPVTAFTVAAAATSTGPVASSVTFAGAQSLSAPRPGASGCVRGSASTQTCTSLSLVPAWPASAPAW